MCMTLLESLEHTVMSWLHTYSNNPIMRPKIPTILAMTEVKLQDQRMQEITLCKYWWFTISHGCTLMKSVPLILVFWSIAPSWAVKKEDKVAWISSTSAHWNMKATTFWSVVVGVGIKNRHCDWTVATKPSYKCTRLNLERILWLVQGIEDNILV